VEVPARRQSHASGASQDSGEECDMDLREVEDSPTSNLFQMDRPTSGMLARSNLQPTGCDEEKAVPSEESVGPVAEKESTSCRRKWYLVLPGTQL